jgi:menaquinol-cytochrome c reductase cytochrome b/c subunit
MTEIPEHLLKRAQAARDKAAAETSSPEAPAESPAAASADAPGQASGETSGQASGEASGEASRIPAHLLERSRAARTKTEGGDEPGGGIAVAEKVGAVVAPAPAGGGVPVGAGPGGHTQRLLTVVKSGSIQEVKATPVDKVHTWPHLLAAEFVAALACTAFTFLFSIWVNAPLLQLANPNATPNPSKAPWYFLGLQELLTMFHPMVAGVTIPGVGIIVLIFAPYIDKNPSNKPEDRKFATSLMTIHLMFWAVLVMIGSFFRGPGFNFTLPWRDGLFFEL